MATMRSLSRFLLAVAAVFVTPSAAADSCFRTDNYTAVRGRPFTLTWSVDGNNFVYDISIATDDKQGLGYIARNVTQDSVTWTPPLEIEDGPYYYRLFNYERQSTCYSGSFNITGGNDVSLIELDGPQVTSAVTLNGQRELVTATVGSYTAGSGTETTESPLLSTNTASEPTVMDAGSPSDSDSSNSGPTDAGLAIGLGVAFGVLALVSLVLVILFLRIKRKSSERKDAAANLTPSEGGRGSDAHLRSPSHMGAGELSTSANTAELDGYEKMAELEASSSGPNSPVELPAESVSAEWQRAIRRCDSTSKS